MKMDMHAHSRISKRPSVWILNKIGCAESYTEPVELYRLARERGMDAVTITDHNSMSGCLEIAHLPNTVTGVESTAYFPEDGCKVHVLIYGLAEPQFDEVERLRENLYELVEYLNGEGLFHALAHPFYPVMDRYRVSHFEKCLLLFKYFEQNGDQSPEVNRMLVEILDSLDEHSIRRLSEKHGIEPVGPEPWRKTTIAGSDDHSSLTLGKIHTEVPGARSLSEFWEGVENGRCRAGFDRESSPLTTAHGLYGVAYQFYASKFDLSAGSEDEPVLRFLERMLTSARKNKKLPVPDRGKYSKELPPMISMFTKEAQKLIEKDRGLSELLHGQAQGKGHKAEFWFDFVNKSANQMLGNLAEDLTSKIVGLNPFDIFHAVGAAGAMLTLVAPYYAAFSIHSKCRRLGREAGEKLAARPSPRMNPRVAVFTDTLDEINGVAKTWRKNAALALNSGKDLMVVSCQNGDAAKHREPGLFHLEPARVFSLPEYPEQKVFIPPLLSAMRFCYEQNLTHVHGATPGPMGLVAMAAAKIMGLPFCTTYHTEIPQFAGVLTGDRRVEEYVWKYIAWFYNQSDIIFSPSHKISEDLVEHGIPGSKIRLMPRGVDTDKFTPELRNRNPHLPEGTRLLYVGRVSREKNLQLLARAFRQVSERIRGVHLIVVGDGPYLEEMKRELAGTTAHFTGYVEGDELASVYASCHLFVFPSTTDTFGNVVLEAQASGLPVLVSDKGGPQENLIPGETGLVLPSGNESALTAAIMALVRDPQKMDAMGRRARKYTLTRSYSQAFEQYWEMYRRPGAGGLNVDKKAKKLPDKRKIAN